MGMNRVFRKTILRIWKAKENNNDQWFIANDDVNVVTIIIAPDKNGFWSAAANTRGNIVHYNYCSCRLNRRCYQFWRTHTLNI